MTGFPWRDALAPAKGGTLIRIRVNPHSSREGIEGTRDGRLLVKVNAPPLEDRANRAALRLLSDELGIPPSRLQVVRGSHSRNKDVLAAGWNPDQ